LYGTAAKTLVENTHSISSNNAKKLDTVVRFVFFLFDIPDLCQEMRKIGLGGGNLPEERKSQNRP